MADINLRVRSDDGGRFQSIGEASERLTFAVWGDVLNAGSVSSVEGPLRTPIALRTLPRAGGRP